MENTEQENQPAKAQHQQNPQLSSSDGPYEESERVEVEKEGERPKDELLGGLEVIPSDPNSSYTASDEEADIINERKGDE